MIDSCAAGGPLMILAEVTTVEQAPDKIFQSPGSLDGILSGKAFSPVRQFLCRGTSAECADVKLAHNVLVRLTCGDQSLQSSTFVRQLAVDQVAVQQVQLGRQAAARWGGF